jgi:hypothetical protein
MSDCDPNNEGVTMLVVIVIREESESRMTSVIQDDVEMQETEQRMVCSSALQ